MEKEILPLKEANIRWFDNEIVIESPSGKHETTIIWFHHIYKEAIDHVSFFLRGPTLQFENTRFVLPQAPSRVITVAYDKTPVPSWFDVLSRDSNVPVEEVVSIKDLKEIGREIQQTIEREIKFLNGDGRRVFLGGFGQGTAVALTAGLQSKEKVGGIFGVEGYFISVTEVSENNKDTPVHVVLGKKPPDRLGDMPDGDYLEYQKTFDVLKGKKSENTSIELIEGNAYYDQESIQKRFFEFVKSLIKS